MKIAMYGNGGSGNHGCEAIVRGTIELIGDEFNDFYTHSIDVEEDKKYELDKIAEILNAEEECSNRILFFTAYIQMKLFKNYGLMDVLSYKKRIKKARQYAEWAFSIGGDNYCYGGTDIYGLLNKSYNKQGIRTVLWGCSIEPSVASEKKVQKDLQNYNLIVARESITYEAVKKINRNTILLPDPAFYMKSKICDIDYRISSGNVIGINISPMILSNEKYSGITLENYRVLIRYILKNTDAYVALIPHVVWEKNDDRKVLEKIYDEFNDDRIISIEDKSAPELKYIISKCRLFVGARTHATIAAYSSCVPTLVVGYSVKARGIARDLFGAERNYVLSVQKLKNKNELLHAFTYFLENEESERQYLENYIPNYKKQGKKEFENINWSN